MDSRQKRYTTQCLSIGFTTKVGRLQLDGILDPFDSVHHLMTIEKKVGLNVLKYGTLPRWGGCILPLSNHRIGRMGTYCGILATTKRL